MIDLSRKQLIEMMRRNIAHSKAGTVEDYYTGLRIQRAARTRAKKEFLFGRNESGGQNFHRRVDAIIDTASADLPALFFR